MPPVNVHTAKTHLSRLIDRAAAGEDVIISRSGKPVAVLTAYRPAHTPRKLGVMKGKVKMKMSKDFDAPLPPDILAAFEGKT